MANNNEALVLSAANLKTIEDNLEFFAKSLGTVNTNITDVTKQMSDVTQNVLTLEEEIKELMQEIKGTTIVSNAKQSIVISQNEWQKKFQHHEQLRRNIVSIMRSTNLGLINKASMQNFQEDIMINTPNYWLAPAIIAISAWLSDDKETASKALHESLRRDKSKTSLLMCLIYLQVNRHSTATKWLEYYLSNQNPVELDSLIIVLLNSLNTKAFNYEQQMLVLEYIEKWLLELNNYSDYKEENINTWLELLNSLKMPKQDEEYPAIRNYTSDEHIFQTQLNIIQNKELIYNFFNVILNREDSQDYDKSISLENLIDLLVNEYDGEELALKKDIYLNNLIVEANGDLKAAEEKMEKSKIILQDKKNLYVHLHNTIFKDNFIRVSNNTKKMALSFQKENIINAYNRFKTTNVINRDYVVNINIDGYVSQIKDGYEEKTEKQKLMNHMRVIGENKKKTYPLFNIKMIIAIILAIGIVFVVKQNTTLMLIILAAALGFCAYEFYNAYSARKNIDKLTRIDFENKILILEDLIAEIVDLKEIIIAAEEDNKLDNLFNNLDYKKYLVNQEERNIRIGVSHE